LDNFITFPFTDESRKADDDDDAISSEELIKKQHVLNNMTNMEGIIKEI